jgi:glutamate carboxypeptidase
VVAAKAIVMGDLRFISEAQKKQRGKDARDRCSIVTAGCFKITFDDGYPAMTPSEQNYELLRQMDQVSQDLASARSRHSTRRSGAR